MFLFIVHSCDNKEMSYLLILDGKLRKCQIFYTQRLSFMDGSTNDVFCLEQGDRRSMRWERKNTKDL